MIKTSKVYLRRMFFQDGKLVAVYYINVINGRSIKLYRKHKVDLLAELQSEEICGDQYRLADRLAEYFDRDVAEVVAKYMKKDMNCPKNFSPESYVRLKESQ